MRIQGEQEDIRAEGTTKLTLPQVHKKLEEYFAEELDILEARKVKNWQIRCLIKAKNGLRIVSVEYNEELEMVKEEWRQ